MTPSSAAGIIGAIAGVLTAVGLVITALTLFLPQLRLMRSTVVLAQATAVKVDAVHQLVDGNLTAAKERELEATQREYVTLQEVARLHDVAGHSRSPAAEAELARTKRRIAEMDSEITERKAREAQMAETTATTEQLPATVVDMDTTGRHWAHTGDNP